MNFIKKVILKLSKKPMLGIFYILEDKIYYHTYTTSFGHRSLWKLIIDHLFYDTTGGKKLQEMYQQYNAADRGRVDWDGELIDHAPIGEGKYILNGTPGCQKYETLIKSTFGLNGLPENKLKIDLEGSHIYDEVDVRQERIFKKFLNFKKIVLQNTLLG